MPIVFNANWHTSFKAVWWSISEKITFWPKTLLSLEFRGPNSAHPEVFRCSNCNGTSFKVVWWSVSEKTHFGIKHHFPSYLEGKTQHTLKFSNADHNGTSLKFVSCFWENTFWAKTSLYFIFRGPASANPQCVQVCQLQLVQVSKLYDDPFLRKHILG